MGPTNRWFIAVCAFAGAAAVEPRLAPASEPRRELYTRHTTWVWSEPIPDARRLGFVRAGTALGLRDEAPVRSRSCADGYRAVVPRGWVCQDEDVTSDRADRSYRVAQALAPRASGLPFGYVISNGVPMYRRLPTPTEWEHAERDLGKAGTYKKYRWNQKHERLAEERVVAPSGKMPFFLADGGSARSEREAEIVRVIAPLGTMLAYVNAFEHAGRTWLVSSDGLVFPADRTRPYRASAFRGLALGADDSLPIAWVRGPSAARLDGSAAVAGEPWSRHSAIRLDPALQAPQVRGKRRLWQTLERARGGEPVFVDEAEVTVARAERRPASVPAAGKWIAVSIRGGTLVAYEGDRPVFTTLISPGAGGVPREGVDHVKASTTPLGTYPIQYKYRSQTMSPQKEKPETERTFWIAEVPHAQYFHIPFALHTTYWHDDFGQPMSGGCVNLAPADGRWMFEWTSPALPEGWEGVWAGGENGKGTVVVLTR